MKNKQVLRILLLCLSLLFLLVSCKDRETVVGGQPVTPEAIYSLSASIRDEMKSTTDGPMTVQSETDKKMPETVTTPDTTEQTEIDTGDTATTAPSMQTEVPHSESKTETTAISEHTDIAPIIQPSVVYWVRGGSVYHLKSDCSSLSRSSEILSGTIEDAIADGKERVCSRCGKENE